jgi:glycosyltransferase involved in cell wall biosynthesis
MRICFAIINYKFFHSHRLNLIRELAKIHSVSVVTDTSRALPQEIKYLISLGIEVIHLPSRSKKIGYISYALSLRRVIHTINPVMMFYVTLEMSIFGAMIHHLLKVKKSFFLITGLGPFFHRKKFKYSGLRTLQRLIFAAALLKKSCVFIFQNADDLKLFIDLKIANESNVQMIRGNGINTNAFIYKERAYGNKIIFLYASRLVLSKGIVEFINASKLLKREYPEAEFLIAGSYDAGDPDSISSEAFNALVTDKDIIYLGELPHSEMLDCFYKASVFVMPSYGEGLPKVALEASASGLPLVTTDTAGCKDCVENEVNGFLVKAQSSEALHDGMELCMKNLKSMKSYGQKSAEMVNKKYSLELITQAYLKLIKL